MNLDFICGIRPLRLEDLENNMSDQSIPPFKFKPITTFTFPSSDGREAVIDFGGDAVTYSGDLPIDESAKIFFEAMFGYIQPKTCRMCHWYKPGSPHDNRCQCPKILYGYSCKYGSIKPDEDGLAVENDEGWGMSPEPGFGCIHHKRNHDTFTKGKI